MTLAKRFAGMKDNPVTREINLLQLMGHKTKSTCGYCRYFVDAIDRNRHCKLNPACDLPVQQDDYCNFFTAKPK